MKKKQEWLDRIEEEEKLSGREQGWMSGTRGRREGRGKESDCGGTQWVLREPWQHRPSRCCLWKCIRSGDPNGPS